jgi:hypothetical protein
MPAAVATAVATIVRPLLGAANVWFPAELTSHRSVVLLDSAGLFAALRYNPFVGTPAPLGTKAAAVAVAVTVADASVAKPLVDRVVKAADPPFVSANPPRSMALVAGDHRSIGLLMICENDEFRSAAVRISPELHDLNAVIAI